MRRGLFFALSSNSRRRTVFGLQVSLTIEALESRTLLSATALPTVNQIQATTDLTVIPAVTSTTPSGYTPAQVAQAYGFNQITLANGIQGTGAGQTIAIVNAYNTPNILSDLETFDQEFGLANPPKFTRVLESGASATPNPGWALETALDVEWAHAMAPVANILLVEAKSASLSDLLAAVNYARSQTGVAVVSMSWGAAEFSSETAYDGYFTTPSGHTPVSFVASAGDDGAGTLWPSISPNVLAVGGATLDLSAQGNYVSETAWAGSGGGYSAYETEPSFQKVVQTSGRRSSSDVSYDADPSTGFAVYSSVAYDGQTGWFDVGGTSAGAPQWAALLAIADQGRALVGQTAIGNAAAAVYTLPTTDFHDITTGSNGYAATTGYDLPTGLGTPYANLIVASFAVPPVVTPAKTTTTTTTTPVAPTKSTKSTSHHSDVLSDSHSAAQMFAGAGRGNFG